MSIRIWEVERKPQDIWKLRLSLKWRGLCQKRPSLAGSTWHGFEEVASAPFLLHPACSRAPPVPTVRLAPYWLLIIGVNKVYRAAPAGVPDLDGLTDLSNGKADARTFPTPTELFEVWPS